MIKYNNVFDQLNNEFYYKVVHKFSIISNLVLSKSQIPGFYIRVMKINKLTRHYKETILYCQNMPEDGVLKISFDKAKFGIIFNYRGEAKNEAGITIETISSKMDILIPDNFISYWIQCRRLLRLLKRSDNISIDFICCVVYTGRDDNGILGCIRKTVV